ncbi:hypothetical protein F2Q70_00030032 [Brassica cretica]|uniref:Uncharacterized protein n=1 Tax=Brassica cretica TaxID=69181 RepID=A0A8S9FJ46_BRACR|nr:hypothetical protein F2Q70_00030032 [Brassica cretica]
MVLNCSRPQAGRNHGSQAGRNHSSPLERSPVLSIPARRNHGSQLRNENQALNPASNKKRRFQARVRPRPTWKHPNLPVTASREGAPAQEKAQTYDVEESESDPESVMEAPDRVMKAKSHMIAYLEQMFSKRLDNMQSMVERLPGVAPPIRKSNPDSYAGTPFTDEITSLMPKKFSIPNIKA